MRALIKSLSGHGRKAIDWKTKAYWGVVFLLLGSFVLQALFFAFLVREGIAPEENYHLSLLFLMSHTDGWFLQNSEATHFLGNLEREPFLYHLVFGKALLANRFLPFTDYAFLKCLHLLLAFGTIVCGLQIAREVTPRRTVHVLALGIMTHLLGFVFYASAIHPFTFLSFVTAGEVLFLIRFCKYKDACSLFYFLSFFFAATLVSAMAMAINAVIFLIFVMQCLRIGRETLMRMAFSFKIIPAVLIVLFGFSLNLLFYGSNLIEYGRLTPECHQVLSLEQCMSGRYLFRDDIEKFGMEKRVQDYQSPSKYLGFWLNTAQDRLTGIAAYQKYCKNQEGETCGYFRGKYFWHQTRIFQDPVIGAAFKGVMIFALAILSVAFLIGLSKFNAPEKTIEVRLVVYLFLITLFCGCVLFWMDYGAFQGSGKLGFGFQEYRFFPALPFLAFLTAYFLLRYLPQRTQPLIAGLLLLMLFWSTMPTFLLHDKNGELLADKENIVSLLKCDDRFGYCSVEDSDQWSYCVPDRDWQCLSEKIGADMLY
jgi:hypothetical protein